ncbi:MAG: cytochrome c biogenesis protein DipZ [Patescibacteria group bacterium]
MILLIGFSFIAGIVTILSPCILPILPVVLSGSVGTGKNRPLGIIAGFVASFTFFTLFLSAIVRATGLSADLLRGLSVLIILGFGISLVIPKFQEAVERFFSGLARRAPSVMGKNGFFGGLLIGLSLGLVWTPCVGPILASIITLSASNNVSFGSLLITLSYSIGTAIPMLIIMKGGGNLLAKVPSIAKNTRTIQQAFGILMVITAIAIFFNLDRRFQAYILEKIPSYGVGLTSFEDNPRVKEELNKLKQNNSVIQDLGSSLHLAAPELILGGQWYNSEPLSLSSLKGKVVLIDFWTYTCINCIRTLPYLKNWHEKYRDKGLVIIGVHTPEFEFEKNPENVFRAISDFGIKYPVMQDNDYATWRAYNNRYWPAKYFIDKSGKIRSTHFGEGEYDESEAMIQLLLKEAGTLKDGVPISNDSYSVDSQTPETYLGNARLGNLLSDKPVQSGKLSSYSAPKSLGYNQFAFEGDWKINEENAEPSKGSTLIFNYSAKDVFLVMGPKNRSSGLVSVYLDGRFIKEAKVDDYQLYDLIRSSAPGRHVLKLEFLDSNLELFAFTFG